MLWQQFLIILALTAISLVIFYYIRITILLRYKINKNYLLVALIILFALPFLFAKKYRALQWIQYIQVLLVSLTFLSYMEIARIDKAEKNKPIIGRPKAKPSRIKNKKSK
ncbi:MAG: hypothetical protein N2448_08900 [Caloramator sp.]|nr:hypothetical protein [Caloramator sp.]